MVHYEIKQYTFDQAKKHGFEVKVSTNKKKKIDVYRDNVKIASIGDLRYKDYPTYLEERGLTSEGLTSEGLTFVNVRRALYHNRHKKNIEIKGSNGWLSSILLW